MKRELIDILVRMGFTAELGEAIAANLRTEKPMNRMIGYLLSAQPRTEEDIVDRNHTEWLPVLLDGTVPPTVEYSLAERS